MLSDREQPETPSVEKLQKELADARARIAWLQRREDLLRKQFAFYVQYGQTTDPGEYPKL